MKPLFPKGWSHQNHAFRLFRSLHGHDQGNSPTHRVSHEKPGFSLKGRGNQTFLLKKVEELPEEPSLRPQSMVGSFSCAVPKSGKVHCDEEQSSGEKICRSMAPGECRSPKAMDEKHLSPGNTGRVPKAGVQQKTLHFKTMTLGEGEGFPKSS